MFNEFLEGTPAAEGLVLTETEPVEYGKGVCRCASATLTGTFKASNNMVLVKVGQESVVGMTFEEANNLAMNLPAGQRLASYTFIDKHRFKKMEHMEHFDGLLTHAEKFEYMNSLKSEKGHSYVCGRMAQKLTTLRAHDAAVAKATAAAVRGDTAGAAAHGAMAATAMKSSCESANPAVWAHDAALAEATAAAARGDTAGAAAHGAMAAAALEMIREKRFKGIRTRDTGWVDPPFRSPPSTKPGTASAAAVAAGSGSSAAGAGPQGAFPRSVMMAVKGRSSSSSSSSPDAARMQQRAKDKEQAGNRGAELFAALGDTLADKLANCCTLQDAMLQRPDIPIDDLDAAVDSGRGGGGGAAAAPAGDESEPL
jgi:hypothetical protein